MTLTKNLVLNQGASFSQEFIITDSAGAVRNLTGYTATAQMRKGYYSQTNVAFTVAQVDVEGKITISLDDTETAALSLIPSNRYVYDVEITDGSDVERVREGIITIKPEVTK
jgi:hypothetical protein